MVQNLSIGNYSKILVKLGDRSYPIEISSDYSSFGSCLDKLSRVNRIAVVCDENVDRYQTDSLLSSIPDRYKKEKLVIPSGEAYKNLDTVKQIYSFLLDTGSDRDTVIAAHGGGVTGDMAGFAAATYLRGIRFVQVPTTLLSMADSSVGGKTGVDYMGCKNMVGAFHQPSLVYINTASLQTLPCREFISGLAEVVKHSLILDRDFAYYLYNNMEKIHKLDKDVLEYICYKNCSIKASVVEQDETEQGIRSWLNFGHTIGHAIETALDFKMLHGECVAVGMSAAIEIALGMKLINQEDVNFSRELIKKAGLPVSVRKDEFDVSCMDKIMPDTGGTQTDKSNLTDRIFNLLFKDKKTYNGRLNFILPEKTGKVNKYQIDDMKLVKNAISYVINS